jgi:hypothetical protein
MLQQHMVITKHPHGRWSCTRDIDGDRYYLIENDLVTTVQARHLFWVAQAAWRPEIGVKVMHHPVEAVRFAALLPKQSDGRHRLTFEFIKLCFEALHPDWESGGDSTTQDLSSVGV